MGDQVPTDPLQLDQELGPKQGLGMKSNMSSTSCILQQSSI